LHPFPHLRTLSLSISSDVEAGKVDGLAVTGLLSSIRDMPQLSSLIFIVERLLAEHTPAWRTLLDGLDAAAPHLRELTFNKCTLPSLSKLTAGAQLRVLSLRDCCFKDVGAASAQAFLQWVQSMRHLEQLSVIRCFLPLSSVQRMQLTPPSSFLPSLQRFICEY
jgi:hypothetical protein